MKILWCEEHGQAEDGEGLCHRGRTRAFGYDLDADCRMVPMRLIPDRYLVATVTWGGEPHWIIPASALAGEDTDGN